MRVLVVGYGVVGQAQAYLVKSLGHQVFIYDPYVFPERQLEKEVDLVFICTREDNVEEALCTLLENGIRCLFVIKSTVPPGTTEHLMKKYNIHICHNPEFLRENSAFHDVMNPDRIVIGECCSEHGKLLALFYEPLNRPVIVVRPVVSELGKLVANAHLAMLISFWNEVTELASVMGLDMQELSKIVTSDSRISTYGTKFFGQPFGGKCLPKDLNHLLRTFTEHKISSLLLQAVKEVNERLKQRVLGDSSTP